jgi:hypothetical protein
MSRCAAPASIGASYTATCAASGVSAGAQAQTSTLAARLACHAIDNAELIRKHLRTWRNPSAAVLLHDDTKNTMRAKFFNWIFVRFVFVAAS